MTQRIQTTRPASPAVFATAWCAALLLMLSPAAGVLAQNNPAPATQPADTAPEDATDTPDAPEQEDQPEQPNTPDADGTETEEAEEGAEGVDPPDDEPAPPPEPTLTVRELVVLQTDRYGETANDTTAIASTLFVPINQAGRLKLEGGPEAQADAPMPVGLISFEGEIEKPLRVRLDLVSEEGAFHAHYPNDAIKGDRAVEWIQVQQATDQQRPDPPELDGHWLQILRESDDRLWLRTRDPLRKERFLLYDASLPFKPALKLDQADAGMTLSSTSDASGPPLAIVVNETETGWQAAATQGPWANEAGVPIDLAGSDSTQANTAKAALSPLADLLAQRGYNPQEIETAIDIVAGARLNTSTMSLVYVLPEGEIDKHIWLRFRPEPDRVVRTAIVVVNNVDPGLGNRLDKLVEGLGDERWAVREKCQRELEAIGLAAIRRVQAARDHPDPEVAFRVRQILDAYDLRQQATE